MNDAVNYTEDSVAGTLYRGVKVLYDESHDKWRFILRGKERSSGTLALAKEAIDAPIPKDAKPFNKINCYTGSYGFGSHAVVTVTSETEYGQYRYRTPGEKGTRTGYGESLKVVTPENTAKLRQIKALHEEKANLVKQIDEITKSMLTLKDHLAQQSEHIREYLAGREVTRTAGAGSQSTIESK